MAILNRRTLVLAGCAIALTGAVLLIESRTDKTVDSATPQTDSALVSDATEATGELMFPFSEEDVERFTLSRPGETLAFSKDSNGFWQMSAPQAAEAEGGAIAFLLDQLTSTAMRSIEVAPDTLEKFGLADPKITIELVAAGKPYKFLVGSADFTGDQRYVRAIAVEDEDQEATADTVTIHLVSGGITNAVERPTAEWLLQKGDAAGKPEESSGAPNSNTEKTDSKEKVPEKTAPENKAPSEKIAPKENSKPDSETKLESKN